MTMAADPREQLAEQIERLSKAYQIAADEYEIARRGDQPYGEVEGHLCCTAYAALRDALVGQHARVAAALRDAARAEALEKALREIAESVMPLVGVTDDVFRCSACDATWDNRWRDPEDPTHALGCPLDIARRALDPTP